MSDRRRHKFRIDALSKATIPMRDLAAYIMELSELLGHHESVHFHEVTEGSVAIAYDVDPHSIESIHSRLLDALDSDGDPSARNAYQNLNQRLKRDRASGSVLEESGTDPRMLVVIPGILEETACRLPTLWEAGSVDGIPIAAGGRRPDPDWVSVRLYDAGNLLSCEARPSLAIALARHLLTATIRAHGKGRWVHDGSNWRLDKFRIEHFDPLDDRPMSELVSELRELYAETDWASMEDPVHQLQKLRTDG
jgi:hypothetical protein